MFTKFNYLIIPSLTNIVSAKKEKKTFEFIFLKNKHNKTFCFNFSPKLQPRKANLPK